ncbi:MAG TPA: GH116 family glycosyl-hydrolase, partial [Sediminibacterium sp.]|nr:GH116 family glycosyl-hydrolase [Sediminibacterium sp.]
MGPKKLPRRDFIRQTGITASGLLLQRHTEMMSRMPAGDMLARKQRDALYERGTVTTYLKSKDELKYIGMPVSGQHTGTLYLSGDGRLWLWDIFNLNQEGINPLDVEWRSGTDKKQRVRSRDGSAYLAPARSEDIMPLLQGFAIECKYDGKTVQRRLCAQDWSEVAFEATYPVAKVIYTDAAMPVEVHMQAYSPFIPLNEDDSGLPVTTFTITIQKQTRYPLSVRIVGWLENKTALHSATTGSHYRENQRFSQAKLSGVYCVAGNLANAKKKIEDCFDAGTLCIACLSGDALATTDIHPASTPELFALSDAAVTRKSAQQQLVGTVQVSVQVDPGKQQSADYLISWHTPNLVIGNGKTMPDKGRYYANRFQDAKAVAEYVTKEFTRLSADTLQWHKTWYDATLPCWFLERSFLNISTLATTTSHRFRSGRYWAWEGVGACEGNCTHVWHYAQAPSRLFPAMERDNRERVDLGISLMPDGGIWFRGEYAKVPAIDGQAGRVLGIYREHQ